MTPKPKGQSKYDDPNSGYTFTDKKFMEQRAKQRYVEAQTYLVRKIPVLGIPLLEKLPPKQSYSCPAMATDGTCIIYNPEWVVQQPLLELVHVIAHEVAHVAFKHMTRRKNRCQKLWNVATDYQVNSYLHLMDVGQMPDNCLYDEKYNGMLMSSDAIYNDLLKNSKPDPKGEEPDKDEEEQEAKQGDGDSDDNSGSGQDTPEDNPLEKEMEIAASYGWVEDYDGSDPEAFGDADDGDNPTISITPADIEELEAQIEEAIAHGEFAHNKISGDQPPVSINDVLEPANIEVVDWEDALQEFLTEKVKTFKNWNRPHKKWLQQGFWLPSKGSYGLKDIVIMNDESGSMNEEENQACLTNIDELNQQGLVTFDRVVLMHFTTRVSHIEYFEPGDDLIYKRHSSGGTCFDTVFKKAKELEDDSLIDPSCYIVMTDMYDWFPPEPDHPVLWMSVTKPEVLYANDLIPNYGKITHLQI